MTRPQCDWLDDFLDGDLPHDRAVSFEGHVIECAACQQAVRDWQATCALLKSASQKLDVASHSLVERIERRIFVTPVRKQPERDKGSAVLVAAGTLLVVMFCLGMFRTDVVRQESARHAEQPRADLVTALPSVTLTFPDDVIGVPIDIGDANVTVYWLYPTQTSGRETN